MGENKLFGVDELSVVLKYCVLERVERESGTVHELRPNLRGDNARLYRAALARRVGRIIDEFDRHFFDVLTSHPRIDIPDEWTGRLLSEQNQAARRLYLERIGQLALEQVRSERCAPELTVAPIDELSKAQLAQQLPGMHTHGVIFGEFMNVTNELFPLITDAYVHDQEEHGRVTMNVVAAHVDWLTARGTATRIIYYEHAKDVLREVPLVEPLELASVQFLCLGGGQEQARHKELSERFRDKIQVNPYPASMIADDKSQTYSLLSRSGIPTPRTCIIGEKDPVESIAASVVEFIGRINSGEVVVQPNRGTEGQGVCSFSIGSAGTIAGDADIIKHIMSLQCKYGDVIIREKVGNVDYWDGHDAYSADLRLNVAWDGKRYRAESGYVQAASEPGAVVSSVGTGGRIIKLSEGAIKHLALTPAELETVRATGIEAARTLDLPLAGVDIRLERTEDGLIPWVLDVNPRPAGLSYSEMFDSCEPGVSKNIWTYLMSGGRKQSNEVDPILTRNGAE